MARRLCEGQTTKGRPCRAQALPGSHFCEYHDPDGRGPASPKWSKVRRAVREHPELFDFRPEGRK